MTSPTLFEVFWVPAMLTLSRRSLKRREGLDTTMAKLWELWKDNTLPWRLKARLKRAHERLFALLRENGKLRLQLHSRKDKYDAL